MSNSKNLTKLALLVGLVVGASSPAFAVEQRAETRMFHHLNRQNQLWEKKLELKLMKGAIQ